MLGAPAMQRRLARLYYLTGEKWCLTKRDDVFRMMSLNGRDLGMNYSFELTGTNEREVMRKFIDYAETELKMPVLTADTIYRVQMAIKK
jgi:predicted small metal-binding protein